MINAFLKYLAAEKQYSELTIAAYRNDLTQFVEFLGVEIIDFSPETITHKDIRAFVMTLADNSVALTSINRKISALKSFFNYLRRKGVVEMSPAMKISALKTAKRLPHFIEKSKSEMLLDFSTEPTDDFITERNKTILLLFYSTGIRLAELISLNICSLNMENREVKVMGKGRKERISPLPAITVDKLNSYLQILSSQNVENREKALFVNLKGDRISRSAVYNLVKSTLKSLGVDAKCSPHLLRHTFATHLLSCGVGIESVKELLGHENLATTQIYTHNSIEQLKKVYSESFEE